MIWVDEPFVWRQIAVPSDMPLSFLGITFQAAFGFCNSHQSAFEIRKIVERLFDDNLTPKVVTTLNPDGFRVPNFLLDSPAIHRFHRSKADLSLWSNEGMFGDSDDSCKHTLEEKMTIGELVGKYDLSSNETHALCFQYDYGDGWEMVAMFEKMVPASKIRGLKKKWITAGEGHGVAEDCGGVDGWEGLKEAYRIKDTDEDDEEAQELREWFQGQCTNADEKGLKNRLDHFSKQDANRQLREMIDFCI